MVRVGLAYSGCPAFNARHCAVYDNDARIAHRLCTGHRGGRGCRSGNGNGLVNTCAVLRWRGSFPARTVCIGSTGVCRDCIHLLFAAAVRGRIDVGGGFAGGTGKLLDMAGIRRLQWVVLADYPADAAGLRADDCGSLRLNNHDPCGYASFGLARRPNDDVDFGRRICIMDCASAADGTTRHPAVTRHPDVSYGGGKKHPARTVPYGGHAVAAGCVQPVFWRANEFPGNGSHPAVIRKHFVLADVLAGFDGTGVRRPADGLCVLPQRFHRFSVGGRQPARVGRTARFGGMCGNSLLATGVRAV